MDFRRIPFAFGEPGPSRNLEGLAKWVGKSLGKFPTKFAGTIQQIDL